MMDGVPKRGIFGRISALMVRHPVVATIAGAVVLGLMIFVFLWFEPQKLLIEQTVDEAAPAQVDATPTTSTAASAPRVLSSGSFVGLEHETRGTAKIIRVADGSHVLRIENLDTSNGPDLVVYLSPATPDPNDWRKYAAGAVNLGELKGNRGNQNYAIPGNVDLAKFRSAVIWCRRFTVGFGAAPVMVA